MLTVDGLAIVIVTPAVSIGVPAVDDILFAINVAVSEPDVYVPDVNAFRTYAQKVYLASDEAKAWPKGMLEKVNAMK